MLQPCLEVSEGIFWSLSVGFSYVSIERKNKCVAVYLRLLEQERGFFGDKSSYVYDRASILYALDKLKIDEGEVSFQDPHFVLQICVLVQVMEGRFVGENIYH